MRRVPCPVSVFAFIGCRPVLVLRCHAHHPSHHHHPRHPPTTHPPSTPCLSDADRCSQSDAAPDLGLRFIYFYYLGLQVHTSGETPYSDIDNIAVAIHVNMGRRLPKLAATYCAEPMRALMDVRHASTLFYYFIILLFYFILVYYFYFGISRTVSSIIPPHTRRTVCSSKCPC